MIIGYENSYLFPIGNKNGLVGNETVDFFTKDCTILTSFKPDLEECVKEIGEDGRYVGTVVGKNGKHVGIFFIVYKDGLDNLHYQVSLEYWQNPLWEQNQSEADDELKRVDFEFTPEQCENGFDVSLKRVGSKFIITVNGESREAEINGLIDYTYSFMWIGAASRLSEFQPCIFYGNIDKMHIQYGATSEDEDELFFNNYESFINKLDKNKNDKNVFTSDFRMYTPYKIFDQSNNGNHPIKYSKIWLD